MTIKKKNNNKKNRNDLVDLTYESFNVASYAMQSMFLLAFYGSYYSIYKFRLIIITSKELKMESYNESNEEEEEEEEYERETNA